MVHGGKNRAATKLPGHLRRRRATGSWAGLAATIALFFFPQIGAQQPEPSAHVEGRSLSSRVWSGLEEVDLASLEKEVRRRGGLGFPENEITEHVRRNFRFVFVNKLNASRFLVRPSPQRVADSILAILTAEERLAKLVADARTVHQGAHRRPNSDCRKSVAQITRATKDLRKLFHDSFVEVKAATFNINLPGPENRRDPLPIYLWQAERIHFMLRARIDRYFFSPVPGSVSVSEFEDVSVKVLTDALIELGNRIAKML